MDVIAAHACNNLHLPPSVECINAAVAYLKQFRSGLGRATFSLQQLAIRIVLKNHQRFLAVQLNNGDSTPSLENLPLSVSEKLLAAIESDLVLSQEEKHSLALLLANHSTNHLDYRLFRSNGTSPGSDTPFFEKMMYDCPNLKALDISHRVWKDFNEPGQCCLFKVIACKWRNLNFLCLDAQKYERNWVGLPYGDLGCRTLPCQGQSIIRAICRHLPKLRTLKVTVPPLTCEDVQDLSKMQHLASLRLDLLMEKTTEYSRFKSAPEFVRHVDQMVHAAGRLPSLQKFSFYYDNGAFQAPYIEFVNRFGQLYPDKKLILEQIWLQSNLLGSWPPNLSVEELNILGEDPDMDWDALLQIKGPVKKMYLTYHVPEQQFYSLVEKFGADLTQLTLQPVAPSEDKISIHRVLFACKKLEVFRMKSAMTFYGPLTIGPEHFKHCHEFWLWHRDVSHPREFNSSVIELTKLYFLGSQHFLKRLMISTSSTLEALIQTLEMNPSHTCLDRLEEISFDVNFKPAILLRDVPKALVLLMRRSPFLQTAAIFSSNSMYFPPHWFCNILQKVGISLNKINQVGQEIDLDDRFESLIYQNSSKLNEKMAHRSFNIVGLDEVQII